MILFIAFIIINVPNGERWSVASFSTKTRSKTMEIQQCKRNLKKYTRIKIFLTNLLIESLLKNYIFPRKYVYNDPCVLLGI